MTASMGRVHMMDDIQKIRVHLSALLNRGAHSVSACDSAKDFMEGSTKVRSAVLVSDRRLPGLA